jgi:hypothetical protein
VECKNKLSDVYYSPTVLSKPNDDHKQIKRHFEVCSSADLIPVLKAPMIDRSFFSFAPEHGGYAFRMLHQTYPDDVPDLGAQVRETFRFGHLIPASENAIPANLLRWVQALPAWVGAHADVESTSDTADTQ